MTLPLKQILKRERKANRRRARTAARKTLSPFVYGLAYFNRRLWAKQVEIADAVLFGSKKMVFVRSGHGVGKTAVAAHIAVQWLLSRRDSKVITAATKGAQVKDIMWREIAALYEAIPEHIIPRQDRGELLTMQWRLGPNWYATGVTAKTEEALQGVHAPGGVLVIIDEASGVADEIYHACHGLIAGKEDRLLAIGNPTRSTGWFHDGFRRVSDDVDMYHIDCRAAPWVINDTAPPSSGMVTRSWIDFMARTYGTNHPIYKIRVCGEFDESKSGLLLQPDDIENACRDALWRERLLTSGMTVAGVDVGWQNDQSVIAIIRENCLIAALKYQGLSPTQLAGEYRAVVKRYGVGIGMIDATGIGAGTYSDLVESGYDVKPFIAAGKPEAEGDRAEMFANLRAEAYWNLAEEIKQGEISLLDDIELRTQLAYIPCKSDRRGRLLIASKEDIHTEIGSSPDVADAVCMALHAMRHARIREWSGVHPEIEVGPGWLD